MTKIAWKFLFTLYTSNDIHISGENAHLVQNSSVKKLPIGNGESFLESVLT